MADKRKVEIFSAGCPACDEAVALVRSIACPSCDVEGRSGPGCSVSGPFPASWWTAGSSIAAWGMVPTKRPTELRASASH